MTKSGKSGTRIHVVKGLSSIFSSLGVDTNYLNKKSYTSLL